MSASAQTFSSTTPSFTALTDHAADDHGQLEGRISSIDTSMRTIVVDATTVSVPATATIRHGHTTLAFSDLKVGDQVHVKGSRNATAFVATEVNVQNEGDDDIRTVVSGTVAGMTGACPAVTFTVGTTMVTTTSATVFSDGTCAELANGVTARVRGQRQANGSIAASRVFFEDNDTEGAHTAGAIAGLSGTCPSVTFTLGTTAVTTTASTLFHNGSCVALKNGANVRVRGTAAPDGSITAASVSIAEKEDE